MAVTGLNAQEWRLGASATGGLGWWIYDRGQEPDGAHRGYDRSHLEMVLGAEVTSSWKHKRWTFLAGVGHQQLHDNIMISTEDRRGGYTRYPITPDGKNVSLWQFFGGIGFDFFEGPRMAFGPQIRGGTFSLRQDHPDAEYFAHRWFYDLGLHIEYLFKPSWYLSARLGYVNHIITTRDSPWTGSRHNLTWPVLQVGVGFKVLASEKSAP